MIKLNGNIIGNKHFPNNETLFEFVLDGRNDFFIYFKYENDLDITGLIFIKKFLDDKFTNPKVVLKMEYVPYSRMDRPIKNFIFTLKYFCQLINDLKFYKVLVLDVHSSIILALLNNCVELPLQHYINWILDKKTIDYVFYPDNGACKKYTEILNLNNIPYFYGNKKRNLQTTDIIEYELIQCPDINNKNILIIDDLCATGSTCYKASKKLKACGAKNILMYISHCENSIYNSDLIISNYIDEIFTTDSILSNWENTILCNINEKL